ncbi:MAG: YdiU family protein, partial [Bradymonadaceae bacterium]
MLVDFDNTYLDLPDRFYERTDPAGFDDPTMIRANGDLARRLGIDPDWLASPEGAEFAVGNRLPDGAEPVALAYAGHQFGSFVPQLGDGRALLLGDVVDGEGERFDIQLKGSGRTPFSRRGDGRAPLGPVLREYLVSEAMHALGIPTTRALAAATTGEQVRRDGLEPGAVLVRVARSHIRVGTFQYVSAREDVEALRELTTYALDRHYPELDPESPVALFDAVADRQAELVAQWQLAGFVHGVMNTDNMLVSGETIDYGPCAFMNAHDPATVFSSIDDRGRYAYQNQPGIARWNLERFAGALAKLGDDTSGLRDELQSIVDDFPDRFEEAYAERMARKLGLGEFRHDDWTLSNDLLERMHRREVDFTLAFRRLAELADPDPYVDGPRIGDIFELPAAFDDWLDRWRNRLTERDAPTAEIADSMRAANPAVVPRNYRVNAAIDDAVEEGDFGAFHTLLSVLADPY